eukprot:1595409-Rhodomonas_salina.2
MFGVDPTRDAMPSAICTETELTPWPGGARQVRVVLGCIAAAILGPEVHALDSDHVSANRRAKVWLYRLDQRLGKDFEHQKVPIVCELIDASIGSAAVIFQRNFCRHNPVLPRAWRERERSVGIEKQAVRHNISAGNDVDREGDSLSDFVRGARPHIKRNARSDLHAVVLDRGNVCRKLERGRVVDVDDVEADGDGFGLVASTSLRPTIVDSTHEQRDVSADERLEDQDQGPVIRDLRRLPHHVGERQNLDHEARLLVQLIQRLGLDVEEARELQGRHDVVHLEHLDRVVGGGDSRTVVHRLDCQLEGVSRRSCPQQAQRVSVV